jgi:rRNA-processing protein FCF1
MKRIILDTDFLIDCAANKVDYVEEIRRICNFSYEIFIIDRTVDELDYIIENSRGNIVLNAKLAKLIITKKGIEKIVTNENKTVDTLILANVTKDDIVATMDAGLKHRLKNKGVQFIVLRKKQFLVLLA